MAYVRTRWVSEETALSADNMNNIEDGIEEALESSEIDASVISLYQELGWEDTSTP